MEVSSWWCMSRDSTVQSTYLVNRPLRPVEDQGVELLHDELERVTERTTQKWY